MDIRCQLGDNWQLEESELDEGTIRYHLMVHGTAVLKTSEAERQIKSGDFIVFPSGSAHQLSHVSNFPPAPLHIELGQQGLCDITSSDRKSQKTTEIWCGKIQLPLMTYRLFRDNCPHLLVVSSDQESDDSINSQMTSVIRLIRTEITKQQPGSKVILDHLSTVLFGYALRCLQYQSQGTFGLPYAIQTKRLLPALLLIIEQYQQDLTIDAFAKACFMSKATFARHFQDAVGKSASEFLCEVRMLKASRLLETTSSPVEAIAESCGYQSVAAFQRRFKFSTGLSPASWRRTYHIDNARRQASVMIPNEMNISKNNHSLLIMKLA